VYVLLLSTADAQTSGTWQWNLEGNLFAGGNYQYRKFDDFDVIESQNWVMGTGERALSSGRLRLSSMISLEPFTIGEIGSPQVFQTGESYQGAPLIDYQHPHDLISGLGASYAGPVRDWTLTLTGALVGSPALGPVAFMHRISAAENPQAPLSHHHLDSTHATPGVITAGASRGGLVLETSWFRGEEPDDDRTDIDVGALDSWSVRTTVNQGAWSAQVSGGRLHNPEILFPGDQTRLTASVSRTSTGTTPTALFAAWGQNRASHGVTNAWMFEGDVSWQDRNHLYSRLELVQNDLLTGHTHSDTTVSSEPARIGAFSMGYTRDLLVRAQRRLGVGTEMTVYYVPPELQENYGGPVSFHFFIRYRFSTGQPMEHHHH